MRTGTTAVHARLPDVVDCSVIATSCSRITTTRTPVLEPSHGQSQAVGCAGLCTDVGRYSVWQQLTRHNHRPTRARLWAEWHRENTGLYTEGQQSGFLESSTTLSRVASREHRPLRRGSTVGVPGVEHDSEQSGIERTPASTQRVNSRGSWSRARLWAEWHRENTGLYTEGQQSGFLESSTTLGRVASREHRPLRRGSTVGVPGVEHDSEQSGIGRTPASTQRVNSRGSWTRARL
jgi:hypothetical protein